MRIKFRTIYITFRQKDDKIFIYNRQHSYFFAISETFTALFRQFRRFLRYLLSKSKNVSVFIFTVAFFFTHLYVCLKQNALQYLPVLIKTLTLRECSITSLACPPPTPPHPFSRWVFQRKFQASVSKNDCGIQTLSCFSETRSPIHFTVGYIFFTSHLWDCNRIIQEISL